MRAYDEDTGEVLWTGTFTGSTAGVPVSYEAKGRQYFVMISSVGGGRRGGVAGAGGGGGSGGAVEPAEPLDPKTPIGAIAFALPKKETSESSR